MAATIKDISAKTDLSISTISKYINGGTVRPKNKLAIEQAIHEFDFHVNEYARGLRTNKTKTIGVIIPLIHMEFSIQIISHAETILRQSGYGVIVCNFSGNEDAEQQIIDFLINKNVDGIIAFPAPHSSKNRLSTSISKDVPIIYFNSKPNNLPYDCVMIDNMNAVKDATSYLIDKGHTSIGIVNGPVDNTIVQERMMGYLNAFYEKGLHVDDRFYINGDLSVEASYRAVKDALTSGMDITALLATNYEMSVGTTIAIKELGIKIPDDMSVIGFDDLQIMQIIQPKMTLVTQPMKEMAEIIADLTLKRLSGTAPDNPQIVRLKAGFSEGDSVKDISNL